MILHSLLEFSQTPRPLREIENKIIVYKREMLLLLGWIRILGWEVAKFLGKVFHKRIASSWVWQWVFLRLSSSKFKILLLVKTIGLYKNAWDVAETQLWDENFTRGVTAPVVQLYIVFNPIRLFSDLWPSCGSSFGLSLGLCCGPKLSSSISIFNNESFWNLALSHIANSTIFWKFSHFGPLY